MALSQVNVRGNSIQDLKHADEIGCVGYGGAHTTDARLHNTENVAYVKNGPYSNTYNWGWRDHLNFSWRGQGQNSQGQ